MKYFLIFLLVLSMLSSPVLAPTQTKECSCSTSGCWCEVTFSNFITSGYTLTSASVEVSVKGDFGWIAGEYSDIYADNSYLGRVCNEAGCYDSCTAGWMGEKSWDVTSYAKDNYLKVKCDSSPAVDYKASGCTAYQICRVALSWDEEKLCKRDGEACTSNEECCSGNCAQDYANGKYCAPVGSCVHLTSFYASGELSPDGNWICDNGVWVPVCKGKPDNTPCGDGRICCNEECVTPVCSSDEQCFKGLVGWKYRKPVEITERSGSSLANYQVLITLDTLSLQRQGKLRSDCGNIRFTDSSGKQIPYWVESGCGTSSTKIWVKIPSLPASTTTTIFIYYGHPTATSESNAREVFDFVDEFNGGTIFSTVSYPYGDPHVCGWPWFWFPAVWGWWTPTYPNRVNFYNTGTEQAIALYCYDEGELRASPSLPPSTYLIEVKWRTDRDYYSYSGSAYTNYDDQYGASTIVPKRLVVVNGKKVYEKHGALRFHKETTRVTVNGAINTLYLSFGSAGGSTYYTTYYDYVRIRKYASPEPTYSIGEEEKVEIASIKCDYEAKTAVGPRCANPGTCAAQCLVDQPYDYCLNCPLHCGDGECNCEETFATCPEDCTFLTLSFSFYPGWNLISIPAERITDIKSDECKIFGEEFYYYNPTTRKFQSITYEKIEGGKAYWVYSSSSEPCFAEATVSGYLQVSDLPELKEGSNFLGTTSKAPYDITTIQGDCSITQGPYWWDASKQAWVETKLMKPGKGYWLRVAKDCRLG